MNPRLSWHLCKRDFTGPLKPWILAWFGVCLLHLGMRLWQTVGGAAFPWLETPWRADFVIVVVTAALLIPRILHSEPFVDGASDWRVRPTSARSVLAARMLLIGVLFVVFPALCELAYFLASGFGTLTVAFLIEWTITTVLWLAPLVALGFVTRGPREFFALLLAVTLFVILVITLGNWSKVPYFEGITDACFDRLIALSVAILAGSTAAAAVQCISRRNWLAIATIFLATCGMFALPLLGYTPPERRVDRAPYVAPERVEAWVRTRTTARSFDGSYYRHELAARFADSQDSAIQWIPDGTNAGDVRVGGGSYSVAIDTWPFRYTDGCEFESGFLRSLTDLPMAIWHAYLPGHRLNILVAPGDEAGFKQSPGKLNLTIPLAGWRPEVIAESSFTEPLIWETEDTSIRIEDITVVLPDTRTEASEADVIAPGLGVPVKFVTMEQAKSVAGIFVTVRIEQAFPRILAKQRGNPWSGKLRFDGYGFLIQDRKGGIARYQGLTRGAGTQIDGPRHIVVTRHTLVSPGKSLEGVELVVFRPKRAAATEVRIDAPYYSTYPQDMEDEGVLRDRLAALSFDPNSKDSVFAFIAEVYRINVATPRELPEIRTLAEARLVEIGGDHVDLLLGFLEHCTAESGSMNDLLHGALLTLLEERHKEMILDRLEPVLMPRLLECVERMGWQRDAIPVMLRRAGATGRITREWVEFFVEARDPRAFDLLFRHAISRGSDEGHENAFLPDLLRDLPGFPFDEMMRIRDARYKATSFSYD